MMLTHNCSSTHSGQFASIHHRHALPAATEAEAYVFILLVRSDVLFSLSITILMTVVYVSPSLIVPLFKSRSPLEEQASLSRTLTAKRFLAFPLFSTIRAWKLRSFLRNSSRT